MIARAGINKTARDRRHLKAEDNNTLGIYLEKMRERNSSLQDRLNMSMKSGTPLDSGKRMGS